jgi:hypothetical protein
LEARLARVGDRYEAGEIVQSEYRRKVADLNAQIAKFDRQERTLTEFKFERSPSWDDPAAMSAHLRRMWACVQLGPDLLPMPDGIEWIVPAWTYDAAALEAREAEFAAAVQRGEIPSSPAEAEAIELGMSRGEYLAQKRATRT